MTRYPGGKRWFKSGKLGPESSADMSERARGGGKKKNVGPPSAGALDHADQRCTKTPLCGSCGPGGGLFLEPGTFTNAKKPIHRWGSDLTGTNRSNKRNH